MKGTLGHEGALDHQWGPDRDVAVGGGGGRQSPPLMYTRGW